MQLVDSRNPILYLMVACLSILGCSKPAKPIEASAIANIKHGMTLSEVEAVLGKSHAASSEQTAGLSSMIGNAMPANRISNDGTDRAWGNQQGWFAARFNKEGKLWMQMHQIGGPPPKMP
jgi:hypothetical protein